MLLVLMMGACKPDGTVAPVRTLTVITTAGVDGSPQSGTTSSSDGERITYQFSARPGFKDLGVVLDGERVPASGAIEMDRDHILYAEADSIRVVSPSRATAIALTRSLLTTTDPVSAATALLNTMYTADRAASASAAALERMTVSATAFNRQTDSAALARLDAALAGKSFSLDFPANAMTTSPSESTVDGPLPISIFWVNGILNSPDDALSSAITAKRMIEEIGLPAYGWPRYETKLEYVPTTAERGLENVLCIVISGALASVLNVPILRLYDIVKASCGGVLDVNRALADMNALANSPFGTSESDALSMKIDSSRKRGRGVLILGHSRGTLVSQLALQKFIANSSVLDSDRQKCVGFISIASPRPSQVQLRNSRNLYAEGNETRDLMLHLPSVGIPRPKGFRTNLSDKEDSEFSVSKSVVDTSFARLKSAIHLHGAIPSYLIDAVMRDSLKLEIRRQISRMQAECAPQAVSLSIATHPSGAISGDVLGPHAVVQLRDRDGFTVGSSSAAVTATLVGSGGTMTGTRTIAAANGVAVFADLRITGSGTFRLNFASPGLPTVTSNAFIVSPASCSGIPVVLPFTRNGSLTSSSCLVNSRRAQPYRFDVQAQGVTALTTAAVAFSPFIKVAEVGGRGNYTIWTDANDLALRWLLDAGSYVAAVGTNSGQNGSFTFSGSSTNEDAGTCAVTYVLQPSFIRTAQRLGSGDCLSNSKVFDTFSLGSPSGCAITVQSSAFSPVVEVYARDGSRLAVNNAGTASQARVTLPNCYAGSDSEFVFGVHAYVFSTDPSRSGAYTITFEFSALSAARSDGRPTLLQGFARHSAPYFLH